MTKTGWDIISDVKHRIVGVDPSDPNRSRCALTLGYRADKLWSLRIAAIPGSVKVRCHNGLCTQKQTDMDAYVAPNVPFEMTADMGQNCTALLRIKPDELLRRDFYIDEIVKLGTPACSPGYLSRYWSLVKGTYPNLPRSISVLSFQGR